MKVYQILATIVVEDEIDYSRIEDICNENIKTAVMEDFYVADCITHYELKETIDYPDTPPSEKDPDGNFFGEWKNKAQEVLNKIEIGMRNP